MFNEFDIPPDLKRNDWQEIVEDPLDRFLHHKVVMQVVDVPFQISGSITEIDKEFVHVLVNNTNSETKAHERLNMAVARQHIRLIMDETPAPENTVH